MSTTPTVVLVHGAFADASGYRGVITRLQAEGLAVRAPMNPLRGLAFDADAIARYTTSIEGPVLLVGHSYGGAVISQAAPLVKDVAGLVFLSAFALDAGLVVLGLGAGQRHPPRRRTLHGEAGRGSRRVGGRRPSSGLPTLTTGG